MFVVFVFVRIDRAGIDIYSKQKRQNTYSCSLVVGSKKVITKKESNTTQSKKTREGKRHANLCHSLELFS
jgi:hypothetical protein